MQNFTSSVVKLMWSPRLKTNFAAVTNDGLHVFGITMTDDGDNRLSQIGKFDFGEDYLPVLGWHPGIDYHYTFAVADKTGRISLKSTDRSGVDKSRLGLFPTPDFSNSSAGKPQERVCVDLCWNQYHTSVVAAVFEKFRNEPSLYIWDLSSRLYTTDTSDSKRYDSSSVVQPVFDLGTGESIVSFCWVHSESNVFAVGVAGKGVRIHDLRSGKSANSSSSPSQRCRNLSCRIDHDYHLTATYKNEICFWDMRKLDGVPNCIQVNTGSSDEDLISQIDWMPNRNGSVLTIIADNTLSAFEIFEGDWCDVICNENLIARRMTLESKSMPENCRWSPIRASICSRVGVDGIIAFSDKEGKLVADIKCRHSHVTDFNPIISSRGPYRCLKRGYDCDENLVTSQASLDDVQRIKTRLENQYGRKFEPSCYVNEPKDIRHLWAWIENANDLWNRKLINRNMGFKYVGIKQALKTKGYNEVMASTFRGVDTSNIIGPRPYRFPEKFEHRLRALAICGWCSSNDTDAVNEYLDRLSKTETCMERLCALAIIQGQFDRGVEFLTNSGRSELCTIGAALTIAASSDIKPCWYQTISALSADKTIHPYLRLIFNFVRNEDTSLSYVETIDGLELNDKIAMGCKFFNDALLHDLVDTSCQSALKQGRLDAIFLVGLTTIGVDLLQAYLNRTGDIQTAVMVAILCVESTTPTTTSAMGSLPSISSRDQSLMCSWIECYRDLLDRLGLWMHRAEFDTYLASITKRQLVEEVMGIVCNFCGKTISQQVRMLQPGVISEQKFSQRPRACTSCKKPLPRCAMCTLTMGSRGVFSPSSPTTDQRISQMDINSWFTWCLTCHHGGHFIHMEEWFKDHSKCPVLGCSCHCMVLDKQNSWANH